MTNLPVREMVLYKHGVGFFVRGGAFGGESLTLTFREDEINDVLKSLAVFDKAGGQVLGIHYLTPMDMQARLASSSIRLPSEASLRGLITDLRGRSAELTVEVAPGSLETVKGRVVGLEQPETFGSEADLRALTFVALLDESGLVRVLRFDSLRGVRILDPQADHDLRYFLDTAVGDDARRSVHVRLSAGEHDLAIYYVAPSPTWRVSYRLVAERDEGKQAGKALLQGWGLFDNRLEEDLEDVRVSLVAGQPISFIYDLYSSTIPYRPTVQDEARIAPGPIEYQADTLMFEEPEFERSERARAAPKMMARAAPRMALLSEERARGITMGGAQASAPAQVETRDTGEFFQYIVAAPVSVKRGESALVPIISAEVSYSRELLYNRDKLPDHPVAALRFTNTTGLTLERGPVTVVEDSDYKGDAVVPFTRDTGEIYVPYAVELGIKVTEERKGYTVTAGIRFKDQFLIEERYVVAEVTYHIENRTAQSQVVTIESPLLPVGAEIFDTLTPDFPSLTQPRWRVSVKAKGQASFTRKRRNLIEQKLDIRDIRYEALRTYLQNRWLDEATYASLRKLIAKLGSLREAHERIRQIVKERESAYGGQENLRANLTTLQPTGQEAALRQRVLAQFEALQDRLDALNAEEDSLKAKIAELEANIEAIIAALPHKDG